VRNLALVRFVADRIVVRDNGELLYVVATRDELEARAESGKGTE